MASALDPLRRAVAAYRLRLKRRRLIWRAIQSRHQLVPVADHTGHIRPGAILAFATIRNEAERLPHFLRHHRALGVDHFLIVNNDSDDGSHELLAGQADVSLWRTTASYRESRFGMDWLNWLLFRHGHGHWCLTLDADEALIYPDWQTRDLRALTGWLDRRGTPFMAALMLDLYPQGRPSEASLPAGGDPAEILCWFDATGYRHEFQPRHGNLSIRGGVRERVFFAGRPHLSPHLHKTPLIRWNRRNAYLSSTHIALPRQLNAGFLAEGQPTGVLLHSKFLPSIAARAAEERVRRQHFTHVGDYQDYYARLVEDPLLWAPESTRLEGWRQLVALGLMAGGTWQAMPDHQSGLPAPAARLF